MADKLPVIIDNRGENTVLRALQGFVTSPFVEVCRT